MKKPSSINVSETVIITSIGYSLIAYVDKSNVDVIEKSLIKPKLNKY